MSHMYYSPPHHCTDHNTTAADRFFNTTPPVHREQNTRSTHKYHNNTPATTHYTEYSSLNRQYSPQTPYSPKGQVTAVFQRDEERVHRLQQEVDKQKKIRITFENKLLEAKQLYADKEVQLTEAEFKINSLLNEIQTLSVENKQLRAENDRLNQVYSHKVTNLKHELDVQQENASEMTKQYTEEFQRFKKEGQEYIDVLSFEFEKKIRNLEEKLRTSEATRKELSIENKRLHDEAQLVQLTHEDDIRANASRVRDDEARKWQVKVKTLEQRLKSAEESRDQLQRKLEDYSRTLGLKEKEKDKMESTFYEETSRLRGEIQDIEHQNLTLKQLLERTKNQLSVIQGSTISRTTTESEVLHLRQQADAKKRECDELSRKLREMSLNLKEMSADNEKRLKELQERCAYYEGEARKYKDEYNKICETLKWKISQTISSHIKR